MEEEEEYLDQPGEEVVTQVLWLVPLKLVEGFAVIQCSPLFVLAQRLSLQILLVKPVAESLPVSLPVSLEVNQVGLSFRWYLRLEKVRKEYQGRLLSQAQQHYWSSWSSVSWPRALQEEQSERFAGLLVAIALETLQMFGTLDTSQEEVDGQMGVRLAVTDPQEVDAGRRGGCGEIFGQSVLVSQSQRPWSSVLKEQLDEGAEELSGTKGVKGRTHPSQDFERQAGCNLQTLAEECKIDEGRDFHMRINREASGCAQLEPGKTRCSSRL